MTKQKLLDFVDRYLTDDVFQKSTPRIELYKVVEELEELPKTSQDEILQYLNYYLKVYEYLKKICLVDTSPDDYMSYIFDKLISSICVFGSIDDKEKYFDIILNFLDEVRLKFGPLNLWDFINNLWKIDQNLFIKMVLESKGTIKDSVCSIIKAEWDWEIENNTNFLGLSLIIELKKQLGCT